MHTIEENTVVLLSELGEDPDNANRMDEGRLTTLAEAIGRLGFRQPILARRMPDDTLRIIDGHHRVKAAALAGLAGVPAHVVRCSDTEARVLQLGLNRLRGEVDLAVVARNMQALSVAQYEALGLGEEIDLTLTGFTAAEIDALLATEPDGPGENPLGGSITGAGTTPAAGGEEPAGGFTLELEFATQGDLARARRGLRKAADGGDLAAGLLALLARKAG